MKSKKKQQKRDGFWSSLFDIIIYNPLFMVVDILLFIPRLLFRGVKHLLED